MTTPVELHNARRAGAPTPQNTPSAPASLSRPLVNRASIPESVPEGNESAAQLANNPALASLVQGRLDTLVGRSSGYIESLSPAVRQRLDGLQGIQTDLYKIVTDFQREILALEKKYSEIYKPLYDQRRRIITGEEEPDEELVKKGQEHESELYEDEDEDEEEDEEQEEGKEGATSSSKRPYIPKSDLPKDGEVGVPEFWLTALKNHLGISELITERDEELLKHLIDVRVVYLEKPGFKLVFQFAPAASEFFTNPNQVLEKTYFYQDEVEYEGDFVYDHAEGTQIEWVEGKDLTTRVEQKKQRNKNTNQTRIVKKVVPTESFFSFFSPPKPRSDEEDEDEDEQDEDLDDRLELDYQIGEDFKEQIIPWVVRYFTGEVLQNQANYDTDDLVDDFEEESDDDDDVDAVDANKDAQSAPPTSATPQGPAECKQS